MWANRPNRCLKKLPAKVPGLNYQTTKCSNLADPEQTRQITLAKTWVGEMSGTEKENMTQKGMLSESNRASRQTPSAHAAPFLVWGDLRVARPPHFRNSSQSVPRKLSSTRPSTRPIVFGFVPCRPILEDQKKKKPWRARFHHLTQHDTFFLIHQTIAWARPVSPKPPPMSISRRFGLGWRAIFVHRRAHQCCTPFRWRTIVTLLTIGSCLGIYILTTKKSCG